MDLKLPCFVKFFAVVAVCRCVSGNWTKCVFIMYTSFDGLRRCIILQAIDLIKMLISENSFWNYSIYIEVLSLFFGVYINLVAVKATYCFYPDLHCCFVLWCWLISKNVVLKAVRLLWTKQCFSKNPNNNEYLHFRNCFSDKNIVLGSEEKHKTDKHKKFTIFPTLVDEFATICGVICFQT